MPRTSERGGPQTRVRIAEVAARLFLERGYDAVTVAEVAREAGVSSVTVFNHFARKEDLFLDRTEEAREILVTALRDRGDGVDALEALHTMTSELVDDAHPLSGIDPRSAPFFRTVAASPALIGRAREIVGDLQRTLTDQLEADAGFRGDATLVAAFFLAGYAAVMVSTARRLIAGEAPEQLVDDHRAHFERMFDALRDGVDL